MTSSNCYHMRDLAPELALDILSGDERATVAAHLGECPECREYIEELTRVSDRLLTLTPEAEPPVGFEDRVLAGMGLSAPQPRVVRPRSWMPIAVAAAVAAVVFGVGGWVIGSVATGSSTTVASGNENQVMRFASFVTPNHQKVGEVFAYKGEPSWVYMSVSNEPKVGWVACQLVMRDGSMHEVGAFTLSNGKGSWGADLPVDANSVQSARLVSNTGAVLASASFDNGVEAYLGSH